MFPVRNTIPVVGGGASCSPSDLRLISDQVDGRMCVVPEVKDTKPVSSERAQPAAAPPAKLPAVVPVPAIEPQPRRTQRHWRGMLVILLVLAGGIVGGTYWWRHAQTGLPSGIAWSNGRLEADEIDIATKFAGRVAEVFNEEGDSVKEGQVVAQMDTQDLHALLAKANDQVLQAQRALEEANANIEQQKAQVKLAIQQLNRTQTLIQKNVASRELLDQRQQQLDAANAAMAAANASARRVEYVLRAATHDVELYKINIAEGTLVAPRDGIIQYRLANVGGVLPVGGKVYTMLDDEYYYMDIFLPTAEAGRAKLGAEARILLDALPQLAIPARIIFVAAQSQFTPKAVETRSERDKLMFRVRIRIDRHFLLAHRDEIRAGAPGVGYLLLDPATEWPVALQPKAEG